MSGRFMGWEQGNSPCVLYRGRELTPQKLYTLLLKLWKRDTCAPRMRKDWTEENPTLGQCSITAFLAQDIFGGKVYGVPLGDGNFHCFNAGEGWRFDLTSEQFGAIILSYENAPEQFREAHFAKEEKRLRYEALKASLHAALREMGEMRIALTFDDGPNTSITPQVLDILKENGAVASFFLIARNIDESSAQVVRRAWEMGCEINNHSLTHSHMGAMTAEEIRREVADCTEKIVEITGAPPRFFRPPYIDVSPTLFDAVDLTFICGVGCQDWIMDVSAQERIDTILRTARDGGIVLLHDMPGNVNTVEAVKRVIPELKAWGFRFVTCGQLFDETATRPVRGRLYSSVYQTADRI